MRSLMVRRLAGGDAERPGVRPHEMIARDVAAFLDATERVGAISHRRPTIRGSVAPPSPPLVRPRLGGRHRHRG